MVANALIPQHFPLVVHPEQIRYEPGWLQPERQPLYDLLSERGS